MITKTRRVGPWLRDDYYGFHLLCNEALRLEPSAEPVGGLLGMRSTSRFPDVAAAEKALRSNVVYRWLFEHVRSAVDTTGDKTPFVQFRRARIVAKHVAFVSIRPLTPIRRDKRRRTVRTAVKLVQESIADGTLWLPNPARFDMLEELLTESMQRLSERQPKSVKHPWLRWLAHELCEQIGTADHQLLLQVAGSMNLDCDERTARRYVVEARREHCR